MIFVWIVIDIVIPDWFWEYNHGKNWHSRFLLYFVVVFYILALCELWFIAWIVDALTALSVKTIALLFFCHVCRLFQQLQRFKEISKSCDHYLTIISWMFHIMNLVSCSWYPVDGYKHHQIHVCTTHYQLSYHHVSLPPWGCHFENSGLLAKSCLCSLKVEGIKTSWQEQAIFMLECVLVSKRTLFWI